MSSFSVVSNDVGTGGGAATEGNGGDTVLVKLKDIKIGRRFRTDYGDAKALRDSFKKYGLLQPIGVTPDMTLVYGERRRRAAEGLGWEEIPAKIIRLDDLKGAELAENNDRKNFLVSEKVAIADAIRANGSTGGNGAKKPNPRQKIGEVLYADDLAAKQAGFGNPETYRQAKKVVTKGTRGLVAAMDKGEVSIFAAATLADRPRRDQKAALRKGAKAVLAAAKESREAKKQKNATRSGGASAPASHDAPAPPLAPAAEPKASDAQSGADSSSPDQTGKNAGAALLQDIAASVHAIQAGQSVPYKNYVADNANEAKTLFEAALAELAKNGPTGRLGVLIVQYPAKDVHNEPQATAPTVSGGIEISAATAADLDL